MRHSRFKLSVVALLATSMAYPLTAQNLPRGAYAAAVPVPGQPGAPAAPTPVPVAPQVPGVPRPAAPGAPAQRPEEQMRVVADPATNSLVIYGTAQEFQNIKNILKELDIVPRQVLLDVLIFEVTLKAGESLGVDYEILKKDRVTIFGKTFDSRGAVRTLGDLFPAGPPFGNGLTGIVGGNTVAALIHALATDSRVKILSSPSVLASDNRPARIQVGSEEPMPTGSLATPISTGTGGVVPGTTTSFATSTTVQYRNTGRIVTIIPQVNSQGLVNLQILAEVSQRGANVTVGQDSFPAFDTRQAETTAVVQDGDTLAIGGIIAENRNRSRSGIPYLMDLPVLGRFFGSTSDTTDRTELIMLITPHVTRNRDQSNQITEDFKKSLSTVRNELERMSREREKLQQRPFQDRPTLPGPSGDAPTIPPSPAPARSGVPAGPGATLVPLQKSNLPSNRAGSEAEVSALPRGNVVELGNAERRDIAGPGGVSYTPPAQVAQAETQPAYALSFALPPAQTPPRPVQKPANNGDKGLLSGRKWAVQVAALAGRKDADAMVLGLRNSGYDAYVLTSQVENKTWHRVRVGQFADIGLAKQLKQSLVNTLQFKQAYVAAN
jgi:cell division septation protein DedD